MKSKLRFGIILLSLFFSFSEKANAQAPDWLWAKAIGGTGADFGFAIAVDPAGSGDVYTTGWFHGTVDFDPDSTGTFNLTSAGSQDVFISKLDGSGNFVWAKRIGGTVGGSVGYSIAVDPAGSGDVYTTGTFTGTADFDPDSSGTFNLTSDGFRDIFISKLDSSGNFIWVKQMGGTDENYSRSIAVAGNGDVYIAGYFKGTVDFDPDTSATFYLNSLGGLFDIFISKLDASGNLVWAKRIGGISYDNAFALALDASGNVYTTGSFGETVDFDPNPSGTFYLVSAGGSNIFISKLDSSGNFVWAKAMSGGGSINSGNSIAVDISGNGDVYTTGRFEATTDFDPDSLGTFNLTPAGWADIFISKLDSSGNFIWAKSMGGSTNDLGNAIAIDPAGSGDVYTEGLFTGTVDFDPGAGTFNLTSSGSGDIFISKSDSSGNFIWAKSILGTGDDQSYSIALDPSGSEDVYITGFFSSPSITFDATSLTNAGGGYPDIFIARLGVITGIESVEDKNGISLFPNPASDHFTIVFADNNKKVKVIITDITGKPIYTTNEVEKEKIEVKLPQCCVTDGIYIVRIQTSDSIETKELIIAK